MAAKREVEGRIAFDRWLHFAKIKSDCDSFPFCNHVPRPPPLMPAPLDLEAPRANVKYPYVYLLSSFLILTHSEYSLVSLYKPTHNISPLSMSHVYPSLAIQYSIFQHSNTNSRAQVRPVTIGCSVSLSLEYQQLSRCAK